MHGSFCWRGSRLAGAGAYAPLHRSSAFSRSESISILDFYEIMISCSASAEAGLEGQHVIAAEQLLRSFARDARSKVGKGRALPCDGADEGDEMPRRKSAVLPLAKAGEEGVAAAWRQFDNR